MINIYTIVCTDEYSEEEVVCSFTTEIRAREMTLALQELNHFNLSFYERQTSEFSKPWEELHSHQIEYPLKPPVTDEFRAAEAICSYGGGNDKTKAQFKKLLKERKETLAAYNKSFDKVSEEVEQLKAKKEKARKEWFEKNYILPSNLKEAYSFVQYSGCFPVSPVTYSYYSTKVYE